MDISKKLIIAADVPCGATYNVAEHLQTNSGTGVDFGGGVLAASLDFSIQVDCVSGGGCTLTQGFWKTHQNAWPLAALSLGTVNYTQSQLLSILNQPVNGNGLISLAYQLIATKLNIANGADGTVIAATVSAADALIGSLVVPPVGSDSLASSITDPVKNPLQDYNEGVTGPGHCQ